jgi:hypothetical protein
MFYFSAFATIVDTVAGAKPKELQTLARFTPAYIFLITNTAVSKVSLPYCFHSFLQKMAICFLMEIMGGTITINFKQLRYNRKEETRAHRKRARSSLN